jgi:hypothetical protein
MNTISLNGDDLQGANDSEAIAEMIVEALQARGIDADSFSWSIEVDYTSTPEELK